MSVKLAKHKDFDSFLDALTPAERNICLRLRELILGEFPHLKETWAYGAPYYTGKRRICFIYPSSLPYSGLKTGVNWGFTQGHRLSNIPGALDLGDRKEVAYFAILNEKEFQESLFLEILHEAVLLDSL